MSTTLQLQPADKERFELLKKVVSDGMAICFVVGAALREIKEKQFWKTDGHITFEQFCDAEWGWTKRYCNQLIVDSNAINSLPPSLRKLITSHQAAQELAKLPEFLRHTVVEEASAGGKKAPSAADIKKASPPPRKPEKKPEPAQGTPPPRKKASPTPQARPKAPTDATGLELPSEVLGLWNRGPEAQELITYVSAIRGRLKKVQEANDPLFVEVDFTDDKTILDRLYTDLCRAKPYAICPTCQGKLAKDCLTCKGRGFVSEYYWRTFVPEEARKMRESKG